jgi:hypothetical protein
LVATSTSAGYAESSSVSVDISYWKPSLHGNSDMRTPNSSTVSLKNDLGLDAKSVANFTVNFKHGERTTWYASTEGFDAKNSQTLSTNFNYNNINYLAGDKTNSELKINHCQIGLRNGKEKNNHIFYTNFQLNRSNVKTTINNITTGVSRSHDQSFTSLSAGLGWESTYRDKVNFFAEINPLSLGKGGYCESKLGIKAPLGEKMNFTLGYKIAGCATGKDNDNDRTRVDLRGLYFSLGGKL